MFMNQGILKLLLVPVLLLSTILYAGTLNKNYTLDQNNTNESCAPQQQDEFIPCCRDINPSARGCPGNCGFFVTADALWWKAIEEDLPYAYVQTEPLLFEIGSDFITEELTRATGYLAKIDYNWRAGFRVGFGWNIPYDGWDTLINWTWYRNTSISSVHEDVFFPTTGLLGGRPQTGVVPIIQLPTIANTLLTDSARARWTLLLNMFDWEMARAFFVSEGFSLRPFAGVRGGWIDRKLNIHYGLSPVPPGDFNSLIFPNDLSFKNNYWGIGPRAGIDIDWRFPRGFMIIGNLSATILYGKVFKNSVIDIDNSPNINSFNGDTSSAPIPLENILVKNHNWRIVPNFQMFWGIGWGDCVNCNKMYFSVRAGWETNIYLNLLNLIDGIGITNGSVAPLKFQNSHSLGLVGATVSAKLDF